MNPTLLWSQAIYSQITLSIKRIKAPSMSWRKPSKSKSLWLLTPSLCHYHGAPGLGKRKPIRLQKCVLVIEQHPAWLVAFWASNTTLPLESLSRWSWVLCHDQVTVWSSKCLVLLKYEEERVRICCLLLVPLRPTYNVPVALKFYVISRLFDSVEIILFFNEYVSHKIADSLIS